MILANIEWRGTAFARYSVSRCGKVRNDLTGKILSPVVNPVTGYAAVNLYDGAGGATPQYVHRLVALAFVPRGEECEQVNHLNMDRSDNCAGNLEWTTPAGNNAHARATKRPKYATGDAIHTTKLTRAEVEAIRLAVSQGTSHRQIAKRYGVDHKTVGAIIHRKTWRTA